MNLRKWYAMRGPGFVSKRASSLLHRYSVVAGESQARLMSSVDTLARHGCLPTLPTPGRIVQKYPRFMKRLQDAGVEIAVHSYDHVDLRTCSPAEAIRQLDRAVRTFGRYGIEASGFRCPYLGCPLDLPPALPRGMFSYSSNQAIHWDTAGTDRSRIFETITRLYHARSATEAVCVPWLRDDLVEIPVCVPDDLQLHDGLGLDLDDLGQAWANVLRSTHRRGELFTLLFHAELSHFLEEAFVLLLSVAHQLRPAVWVARLCDVDEWWREKAQFGVEIVPQGNLSRLYFHCTSRATILAKGAGSWQAEPAWDAGYVRLTVPACDLPAEQLPFVGLAEGADRRTARFLEEQGYIVESGEMASRCGIFLDASALARLNTEVALIEHIESSPGPLVRYWRWPDAAKSALCVTGDLDALSLQDYAYRLLAR